MIVDLPNTSTTEVSKRLVALRHSVGAMAMGRVLTLIIVTDDAQAEDALDVASDATRQHPARILSVVRANRRGSARLDAQIRVGGDAGASEIVVLRLYGEMADHGASVVTPLLLPDSPIVAWWPGDPPHNIAASPFGEIARRRITDADGCSKPATQLKRRAKHYQPGDTDLSWTRITRWRGVLAATLDEPPYDPVTSASVTGGADDPGTALVAGWLAASLEVPVTRVPTAGASGLIRVQLDRPGGPIVLAQSEGGHITVSQPDSPVREVPMESPPPAECLAAELRRLDADEVYAAALTQGLRAVIPGTTPPVGGAADPARAQEAILSADNDSTSQAGTPQAGTPQAGTPEAASVRTSASPDDLAADVAAGLATVLQEAVEQRGVAHLALTGGSMGARTVTALTQAGIPAQTWAKVHLWWGDERFVPAGHPDRNDQQARDAGLDDLPVPADQVHSTPAGESAEELPAAAQRWSADLAEHAGQAKLPADATGDGQVAVPRFDVVLLGMGPDTHVASLFPGRDELQVRDRAVVPVTESPKPPPLRLSLTVPAINAADRVWFVVAGADKAEAVATARAAQDDPQVPASWVRGTQETVWWLDQAAAN